MNWTKWKIGLLIAIVCGLLSAGAGLLDEMSWKSFVAVLCTSLLTNLLNFLRQHPIEEVHNGDTEQTPKVPLLIFAIGTLALAGCARLQPGADPLVVNIERLQTSATAGFDAVVALDHADRGFWRTNAPAFHAFVESLRQPVPVQGLPNDRLYLPRYIGALWELDRAKLAYKSVRSAAASNALVAVQMSLKALSDQTHGWLAIVTNQPPH